MLHFKRILFICVSTCRGQPFGSRSFPTMDSRVGVLLPDEPSQQSDAAFFRLLWGSKILKNLKFKFMVLSFPSTKTISYHFWDLFMHMCECLHVCLRTVLCAWYPCRTKEGIGSPRMELQVAVNYNVGDRNQSRSSIRETNAFNH